jgi:hypothetical protein
MTIDPLSIGRFGAAHASPCSAAPLRRVGIEPHGRRAWSNHAGAVAEFASWLASRHRAQRMPGTAPAC